MLLDAANTRHQALPNMLRFLAAIPDHGTPSAEVMAGTFVCLEHLASDTARLYTDAQAHAPVQARSSGVAGAPLEPFRRAP